MFVATGTQFPFDRLIRDVDEWMGEADEEGLAQIGEGEYIPKNLEWCRFLSMDEYRAAISRSTVFVSHAGMGNIISARELGIPIIVVNRRAELGEHRNDHQRDGLHWMGQLSGVYAAPTRDALFRLLDGRTDLEPPPAFSEERIDELVGYIESVIAGA